MTALCLYLLFYRKGEIILDIRISPNYTVKYSYRWYLLVFEMSGYIQKTITELIHYCRSMAVRLKDGKHRVSKCKGRRLDVHTINNTNYYNIVDPESNGGKPQYCGLFEKNKDVQRIAAYHYFSYGLELIEENLRVLEELSERLKDVDPNYLLEAMPKAYQRQISRTYELMGVWDYEDWQNRPWVFRNRYPEKKKLRTKNNWMVRSKSEEMWINSYYDRGIPHVYEAAHWISGHYVDTDITAMDPIHYTDIAHEHCGKMSDPQYVQDIFIPKLHDYIAAGYIPGVNLILTFEFQDLPLSQNTVDATLDDYFGKRLISQQHY